MLAPLSSITAWVQQGTWRITRETAQWLQGYLSAVNRLNDQVLAGSGSPEGVVTAPIGTLYSRSDGGAGTSLYVKESGTGNTGWVGK